MTSETQLPVTATFWVLRPNECNSEQKNVIDRFKWQRPFWEMATTASNGNDRLRKGNRRRLSVYYTSFCRCNMTPCVCPAFIQTPTNSGGFYLSYINCTSKIHLFRSSVLSRELVSPANWPALPTVWHHSSLGRALHQHCTSIAPASQRSWVRILLEPLEFFRCL